MNTTMKKIKLTLIATVTCMCCSCYYDNEEAMYPKLPDTNAVCDTVNVTYTKNIAGIIQENCLSCHASGTSYNGGGVVLDNYADVKNNAEVLLGDIKHEAGYNKMPQGGQKLDDCLIRQVEIWVNTNTPQ
jgi:mono/diheme cytochrome c family protein